MNYSKEHEVYSESFDFDFIKTDTITIKKQVDIRTLVNMLCINKERINYLNPSYKTDLFPANSILVLPSFDVNDFLQNEQANYSLIEAVEKKEILIDDRIENCLTYVDPVTEEGIPTSTYANTINEGLLDSNLPQEYVEKYLKPKIGCHF